MNNLIYKLIQLEHLYEELSNKVQYNNYNTTTIKEWIKTFKKIKILTNIIKYRETRAYTSKMNDNLTIDEMQEDHFWESINAGEIHQK